MATNTNVTNMKFNKLSSSKYGTITPTEGEFYCTPDDNVVHTTGNENIAGIKTFSNQVLFNAVPVINGGKNDSGEGGEIHIACAPNGGWDRDYTTIDEVSGGIRFFNFKSNQVYGYCFNLNHGKGLPLVRMVTSTWISGNNWYRVWSDGWIEQGGICNISQDTATTVTLFKAMSNTNYQILITARKDGSTQTGGDGNFTADPTSTTQFYWRCGDDFSGYGYWMVCGY